MTKLRYDTDDYDSYGFDFQFEMKIACLLTSSLDFARTVSGLLTPNRIDNKHVRWVVNQALSAFTRNGELLDKADLRQMLLDDERLTNEFRHETAELIEGLRAVSGESVVIQKISEFTQDRMIREMLLETPELLDEGKYETIREKWMKVFETDFTLLQTRRRSLDEEMSEVFNPDSPEIQGVPTLIGDLDRYLFGNGLIPGNLGVILGGTGKGESTALIHLGKVALATLPTSAVLAVTLELSKRMYEWKTLSSLGGLTFQEMRNDYIESESKVRRKWKSKTKRFFVEHYFAHQITVQQLRQMLKSYVVHCEYPLGMVTVDYADLLDPGKKFRDDLAAQRYIYECLRAIAQEINVPIWTGCQTNRKGLEKEIVTLEDINEGFGKAQTADIIVALCQSPREKEKNPPEMRAYLAKNRNELDCAVVSFNTNFGRQQFVERDALPVEDGSGRKQQVAKPENNYGGRTGSSDWKWDDGDDPF